MYGVEKRPREIEMGEAVPALLEIERVTTLSRSESGSFPSRNGHSRRTIDFAFGATVIHRALPLSTNQFSARTWRGQNQRRLRNPSMIPEGVDARERAAIERFPAEFRAFRDFLVRKTFDVAEHNHLSKNGIEPLDRGLNRRTEIESRIHVIHACCPRRIVTAGSSK